MRAMMASGMVPRTTMGSTRWLHAEAQAPSSSDQAQSIVMKPDQGSTKNASEIRPETGVMPSETEKIRIIISPHQNIGMEAPVTDMPISP